MYWQSFVAKHHKATPIYGYMLNVHITCTSFPFVQCTSTKKQHQSVTREYEVGYQVIDIYVLCTVVGAKSVSLIPRLSPLNKWNGIL